MSNASPQQRQSLRSFASEMLHIVSEFATPEQRAEWLQVLREHAAAQGVSDLFDAMMEAYQGRAVDREIREIFDLVSEGATSEQWTQWLRVPLEYAAATGSVNLFKALMTAGADGSAGWRGRDGRTLLHAAALGRSADVMSSLLDAGAGPDVNVVSACPKIWGSAGFSEVSALYLAAFNPHKDVARLLVKAGADVNFQAQGSGSDGSSILSLAARGACEELVNDLLQAGADPNMDVQPECRALHWGVRCGSEGIVSALLAAGANKNALDCDLQSPLIVAACRDRLEIGNALMDAGADVEIRDGEGYNALDVAAQRGFVAIVKAILRHGADVNAAHEGATALHWAVHRGQVGVIDALVEAGANIEAKTAVRELTPLCVAASEPNCNTVRSLLQHGADVHARDDRGNTPLHSVLHSVSHWPLSAAATASAVDLLLRSGADESALNHDNETPAELFDIFASTWRGSGVEAIRLLLIRALNDRAWRRRCWLVMLRSRASNASSASCDTDGGSGDAASVADGDADIGGSMIAETDNPGGVESGVLRQVEAGFVYGASEIHRSLRTVVSSLVGLELEGVFRTVVDFL